MKKETIPVNSKRRKVSSPILLSRSRSNGGLFWRNIFNNQWSQIVKRIVALKTFRCASDELWR